MKVPGVSVCRTWCHSGLTLTPDQDTALVLDLLCNRECGMFAAEISAMNGFQYVVDESGEHRAVIIDLKKYRALWEDFADRVLAVRRADEPREGLEEVRKRLVKSGKLHA